MYKSDEDKDEEGKRRDLCEELKLLKVANVRMKKELRYNMRGRVMNPTTLVEEISQLNAILLEFKSELSPQPQTVSIKPIENCEIVNPKPVDKPEKSIEESVNGKLSNRNTTTPKKYNPSNTHYTFTDEDSDICTRPAKRRKTEYKYYCDNCSFKSKQRSTLIEHMRRHDIAKLYSCTTCPKTFGTKHKLDLHKLIHKKKPSLDCSKCDFKTTNSGRFITHLENHKKQNNLLKLTGISNSSTTPKGKDSTYAVRRTPNGIIFTKIKIADEKTNSDFDEQICDLQQKEFCESKNFSDNSYLCSQCGVSFDTKYDLHQHMLIPNGEKRYLCNVCSYTTNTKYSIRIHMDSHTGEGADKKYLNNHKGKKPYMCTECNYKCINLSTLVTHNSSRHGGEATYECELCSYSTNISMALICHKQIHDNDRFYCSHCTYTFYSRNDLNEHEGTHTGNQPYECEFCPNKKFVLKGNLTKHMRGHLLVKCNLCSFETNSDYHLRLHKAWHSKNTNKYWSSCYQVMQCEYCGLCVYGECYLKKHIALKHLSKFGMSSSQEMEINQIDYNTTSTVASAITDNSQTSDTEKIIPVKITFQDDLETTKQDNVCQISNDQKYDNTNVNAPANYQTQNQEHNNTCNQENYMAFDQQSYNIIGQQQNYVSNENYNYVNQENFDASQENVDASQKNVDASQENSDASQENCGIYEEEEEEEEEEENSENMNNVNQDYEVAKDDNIEITNGETIRVSSIPENVNIIAGQGNQQIPRAPEHIQQIIVPSVQTLPAPFIYPMNVPLNPIILNINNAQIFPPNMVPMLQQIEHPTNNRVPEYVQPVFYRINNNETPLQAHLPRYVTQMSLNPSMTNLIFKCNQCEYGFSDPQQLSIHRMMHAQGTNALLFQ